MERLHVQLEMAGYEDGESKIHDIRFTVGEGELVGLIGPNGAGKSTTIKAILGLLKHTEGDVKIGGRHGRYAYIPEQPILYETLTLWEHLELAAAAYGMEDAWFREKAETLLERFRLRDVKHHLPGSFSKGMQQKMMLIVGFLIEPDVYIVDEPFVGLDPKATKDFLKLLEGERSRGAGVLMSTHVLDTAEKLCDRFVLMNSGSAVAQGTLEDIRVLAGLPQQASLFDCFECLT